MANQIDFIISEGFDNVSISMLTNIALEDWAYLLNEFKNWNTFCPICGRIVCLGLGNLHADCNDILTRDTHEIFKKAGYKCSHCGESDPAKLTIDHIIPQIHGGSDHPDNLQSLCQSCNSRKGAGPNENPTP